MLNIEILEIGTELEQVRFFRLKKGRAQWLPFAIGSPEEVKPIVDGIAEVRGVEPYDVEMIASGVRLAAVLKKPFPDFHARCLQIVCDEEALAAAIAFVEKQRVENGQ